MTVSVQQGKTATIKLKFLNEDGSVATPPSSGGVLYTNTNPPIATVSLGSDQETVTYVANILGTDTLTYSGPDGLTTTEIVHVVATTATTVAFDETTFTVV